MNGRPKWDRQQSTNSWQQQQQRLLRQYTCNHQQQQRYGWETCHGYGRKGPRLMILDAVVASKHSSLVAPVTAIRRPSSQSVTTYRQPNVMTPWPATRWSFRPQVPPGCADQTLSERLASGTHMCLYLGPLHIRTIDTYTCDWHNLGRVHHRLCFDTCVFVECAD